MRLRALLLATVSSLAFLSGCSSREIPHVDAPPPCRFENGSRIAEEFQWLCASIQDTIFGIDYYDHIENRFDANVYD